VAISKLTPTWQWVTLPFVPVYDAVAPAVEERGRQRLLQQREPARHGGRIHTPIGRRAADGAGATERQKYAHIVPVESFSGAGASLHKCNDSLKYWA